ncbi:hypothetical protein BC834DRAFT_1024332 [Gloeopeniophorella convolvens]|nr:hypothetical protein BC834DRAFT_1024332 [Gloeopeniophorella convolvens]
MTSRHERSLALPHLGGKSAVILFALTLVSFVVEANSLRYYVQSTLQYRQPFFLFYVVHSAFSLTFPLHLLFLVSTTSASIHLAPSGQSKALTTRSPFPYFRFLRLIALATLGLTVPALLWFASVSLSPITDVTAIWNTNAFFAYVFTVRLFKLSWDPRKLLSVLVATFGVLAVVYGDAQVDTGSPVDHRNTARTGASAKPTAPLVGDLLTLCASVGYGFLQVMYKRHVALPSDPEFETSEAYVALPASDDVATDDVVDEDPEGDGLVYPPPFGLHPNFITTGMGLATFFALWIMLPILHYTGYERFRLPDDGTVFFSIVGIAASGLVFNAGMMILLGIWGPIVVSVGNLLTIVLVFLSDIVMGQGIDMVTPWNLAGSGGIVVAFGIWSTI